MKTITVSAQMPPHQDVRVLVKGNTESPKKALILFHGRGASVENIMRISDSIALPDDMIVMAPEATGHQWYPARFIHERKENEPSLSSALGIVRKLLAYCGETYGIQTDSIVLAGFSQGACLVADYVARNPQKYCGVGIFSGGLIGSDEEIEKARWLGDMLQTSVYIGCDKEDAHIPLERVLTTSDLYQKMHAKVETRIYEGLGHAIHPEGFEFLGSTIAE